MFQNTSISFISDILIAIFARQSINWRATKLINLNCFIINNL